MCTDASMVCKLLAALSISSTWPIRQLQHSFEKPDVAIPEASTNTLDFMVTTSCGVGVCSVFYGVMGSQLEFDWKAGNSWLKIPT